MAVARVSIGIDLGTTNSAMAFAPLVPDAATEVVAIPQLHSYSALVRRSTLPSYLYLPEDAVAAQLRNKALGGREWVAGLLGEKKARDVPGRVVRSAKSWLCHHAVDREAAFLPWGSQEIPPARKISPVRAAALILQHLRDAWNERFAASGAGFAFDAQDITITVPASFDAAAQRLTLAAAREAGFPDTIRLLEEPQAAFYCWLEEHDQGSDLWSRLAGDRAGDTHVLVMDVGGGTSDFSLFKVKPATGTPSIERVAVSDHILLGGDNIDLALAHLAEPRLVEGDGKLTGSPWDHLVARCREVKERALSSDGPPDEQFPVSIPGRGSSLMADARSTRITRSQIEHLVLEGFFPECDADARVRRTQMGLRELGLPYASDSGITRHLAQFLRDRPNVDAVLFNGGSLHPAPLRQRICREVGKWQGGPPPPALVTSEPDLAVARGAAHFGRLLHGDTGRIRAGAAHAVFLEAHGKPMTGGDKQPQPALVCILPHGAGAEESFEIKNLPLELRINRPVRFQTYVSTRREDSKAGDVISGSTDDLRPLPPLQTIARVDKAANRESERAIPVILTARLNELGLLQVSCRSTHPRIRQSLPLDFDLRRHGEVDPEEAPQASAGMPVETKPDVAQEVLAASRERITSLFAQPVRQREKLTAGRLIQSLEKILGLSKGDWNGALVRALWPAVEACAVQRRQSVEHEETWLIIAGFLLRPGFGAAADEARIDSLWKACSGGLSFPNKRVKIQEHILWRRVAGGLSRERQEYVLASELDTIRRQKSPAPELIRLAGSLERIAHETKTELIERFIEAAAALARGGGHCAPYLAALGSLLNRAPFYAGQEAVVSPALVERAYQAFSELDWSAAELMELQMLFLRAARVVGDRTLDVAPHLRSKIADRLEKAGVAPVRTARLRGFVPVPASERLGLFGESLPAGLILSSGPADA
jgi:molecular chaperone DnaK (HSP70)